MAPKDPQSDDQDPKMSPKVPRRLSIKSHGIPEGSQRLAKGSQMSPKSIHKVPKTFPKGPQGVQRGPKVKKSRILNTYLPKFAIFVVCKDMHMLRKGACIHLHFCKSSQPHCLQAFIHPFVRFLSVLRLTKKTLYSTRAFDMHSHATD